MKNNPNQTNQGLTYKEAGVDIEAANTLVSNIKKIAAKTSREGVLHGIGGFGALFEVPTGYKQPVLVSGTDGVGTKLKLAISQNKYDGIGIDLVAMCVNDIITLGAEPLFFLDYFATGKLEQQQANAIMMSIGQGCQQAGCALTGGETAELPGLYKENDFDLAGFCVGVVEKSKIIDGQAIQDGDTLIALASNGIHSNGYSLVRKVLGASNTNLDMPFEQTTLGKELLRPTKIYVKSVLALSQKCDIHGMAHITGGGLLENIPRMLPEFYHAVLTMKSWQLPPIFTWLQKTGQIANNEMMRTFNNGVGLVLSVHASQASKAIEILNAAGEHAWQIGHIEKRSAATPTMIMD